MYNIDRNIMYSTYIILPVVSLFIAYGSSHSRWSRYPSKILFIVNLIQIKIYFLSASIPTFNILIKSCKWRVIAKDNDFFIVYFFLKTLYFIFCRVSLRILNNLNSNSGKRANTYMQYAALL